MDGEVKEVHLLVPHSWIYLDVKDDKRRKPTTWALEATGPTGLTKVGVKREDVQAGRRDPGPLPSAAGRVERMPARLRDADTRRRGARATASRRTGTATAARDSTLPPR